MDLPAELAARPLVPLPAQPAEVPWPTAEWPTGPVPAGVPLEPLLDGVMDPDGTRVHPGGRRGAGPPARRRMDHDSNDVSGPTGSASSCCRPGGWTTLDDPGRSTPWTDGPTAPSGGVTGDDVGTFWANGYDGQSIMVCPGLDLVVVRLGKSTADRYPVLVEWRAAVVDAFRSAPTA